MNTQRPPPEFEPAVFVIDGPIRRDQIPDLCARLRAFCDEAPGVELVCDVGLLGDPDAVAVDAMARLQLTAIRSERRIRFRGPCDQLGELIRMMGLRDALPLFDSS